MDHGRLSQGPSGDSGREAPYAFAAFVLSHAGCGDEVAESRLYGGSVLCRCSRCGEMVTFGAVVRGVRAEFRVRRHRGEWRRAR